MRWLKSLPLKDLLKLLPLGILLPVGIGAASVSPHDAISNISRWIEFLGVREVPTWLAQKSADSTLLALCIFLSILYAIFVFRRPLAGYVLKSAASDVTVSLQGVSATGAVGNVQPVIDWLTPLAERDAQEIVQRLHYMKRDTVHQGNLAAIEPCIDIHFFFTNASVFEYGWMASKANFAFSEMIFMRNRK